MRFYAKMLIITAICRLPHCLLFIFSFCLIGKLIKALILLWRSSYICAFVLHQTLKLNKSRAIAFTYQFPLRPNIFSMDLCYPYRQVQPTPTAKDTLQKNVILEISLDMINFCCLKKEFSNVSKGCLARILKTHQTYFSKFSNY